MDKFFLGGVCAALSLLVMIVSLIGLQTDYAPLFILIGLFSPFALMSSIGYALEDTSFFDILANLFAGEEDDDE